MTSREYDHINHTVTTDIRHMPGKGSPIRLINHVAYLNPQYDPFKHADGFFYPIPKPNEVIRFYGNHVYSFDRPRIPKICIYMHYKNLLFDDDTIHTAEWHDLTGDGKSAIYKSFLRMQSMGYLKRGPKLQLKKGQKPHRVFRLTKWGRQSGPFYEEHAVERNIDLFEIQSYISETYGRDLYLLLMDLEERLEEMISSINRSHN